MIRTTIATVADLFGCFTTRLKPGRNADAERERCVKRAEFVAYAGHVKIADLIPDDLERWIELHTSWKSCWTRLRIANTIKRPFNWALRKGLIDRHPFMSVSYDKGRRGKPMERDVFNLFLRNTKPDLRRIMIFMHQTGARPGEICKLEWTWIDTDRGVIVIDEHKTADSREDKSPRVLVLTDVAIKLLLWLKRRALPDQRVVFINRRGEPQDRGNIGVRIWRLREKLKIPRSVKLYHVRHAWATDLAAGGAGLAELADLLGHTTLEMARYYVHLAGRGGHLKKVLESALRKGRS